MRARTHPIMVARQIASGRFELMRPILALTAFAVLAAASPAGAQMYPGEDVTVNPSAAGTQVLLYPGGKYGRVVHPLLMPGDNDAPIHLHMPAHRVARHSAPHAASVAAAEPALSAPAEAQPLASNEPTPPPVRTRHKRARTTLADTEAAAPMTTMDTAQPAPVETPPRAPAPKPRHVRPAPMQAAAQPPAMGSSMSDFESMPAAPQTPVRKPAPAERLPAPRPSVSPR